MPFSEVADRVWIAHHEFIDINIGLVGGERGLVVVDTYASDDLARAVVADVRSLGAGDVVAVVNTHEHFDHTFGNGELRRSYGADLPIHATEEAAARTVASGEAWKAKSEQSEQSEQYDDPRVPGIRATEIVPADHTFSSAAAIDLGDRVVELVHPGRGHTGGDLVVRVPDADVVLAGDLVEESGPPAYGADSFPLDWPLTLDLVLGLVTPASVVVPGHGGVVDRAFVQEQRADIGVVAETIRDLASRGVRVEDALAEADWPFPPERLEDAVRRGYEQLPRSQKRLPLL
ncbi:MBL fold metallo-hydrolase [Nocardioides sp. TF02-7]|uniref:MBL fold metallo-hydrolase n=1 Tax=Nocardioides sp. TF02-7 TaxID=2917724 RepID=UPI001F069082|nr:MBL fold metallo-hydrolase [Nocardioides sp. TF02-7]UMG92915.1 MBL fold metallo-hydrolase [Nocardioides sp. TF02-7]